MSLHTLDTVRGRAFLAIALSIVLVAIEAGRALAVEDAGALDEYAIGADVSFLPFAEASGVKFKDDGVATPGFQIFRNHGYNWVRLRLFHTPTKLPNNLEYTIAAAQEAKARGFRLLLNYHYSDTWADPQKQFLPKAWEGLEHQQLEQAVFEYTRDTIAAFREAGAGPDMVQVGNEVIGGMMWPDGKLPDRWPQFADLIKAGVRGVEAGRGDGPRPLIMMHIDRGGDRPGTRHFFDKCAEHGVEFDVIGQSYYPWWHGTFDDLRANLEFMAERYQKDIVIVEAAYNWRPAEYNNKPGPHRESPEGQRKFWAELDRIVRATPDGRGKGIFWWEPAVVESPIASRGMFDGEGNALPVITVFDDATQAAAVPRSTDLPAAGGN